MAGKKVNRLIVPNTYYVDGMAPVTSVNNILPVNGNVTLPIPTVPTNVSAFTNDAGYLTSVSLNGYATQSWVQQQGYLTSVPSQYITDTELSTTLADYVLSSSLATVATTGAYSDLIGTPTIPTDTSDLTNNAGFITSAALSGYVTDTDLSTTLADYAQTTDIPTVGNGTITINQGGVQKGTFTVNQSGNSTINLDAVGSVSSVNGQTGAVVLTASDVGALPSSTTIPTKTSDLTNDSGFITNSALSPYALSSSLATVATSGSYNDLSNKPTMPAAQIQSDWNQTDNTAVDFIKNKPTIPSGVVVDQTYDSTSANAQSGVAIEGELANYQSKLVSGTNIKTINNTSLLGSGDIDTSETFIAEYNVTTFQQVSDAYNSGKTIFVKIYGAIGSLYSFDSVYFRFLLCQDYGDGMGFGEAMLSAAGWDIGAIRISADTDLSNLSSTGKAVIDGQWVNIDQSILSTTTSLNGSTNLSYRIDVPNDGHKYEVMVRGNGWTGSTSGNEIYIVIKGNEDTMTRYLCRARNANSGTYAAAGTATCIVSYVASGSTNITLSRNTSWNGSCSELRAIAYRRIGTNA